MQQSPQESAQVCNITGPLIGLPQCLKLVGIGRTAWLDRVKAGAAPSPIKIGRRTLWQESEVHEYIAAMVREHRAANPTPLRAAVAQLEAKVKALQAAREGAAVGGAADSQEERKPTTGEA